MPLDFRSIPNLGPWYRADDIAIANAAQVTSWIDRSGNGLHLTKSASSTAVYDTSAANGRAAVSFSNAVSTLQKTSVGYASLSNNAELDIWLVMKQNSSNANNGVFNWNSQKIEAYLTYSDALYFDCNGENSPRTTVAQPTGWDNNWHVVNLRRGPANNQWIWVDGVPLINHAASTGTLSTGTGTLQIGSVQSGQTLTGHIAEIVWFKRALNPAQWQAVRDELYRYYRLPFQPMRVMRQEFNRAGATVRFRRGITGTRAGARQAST